MIEPIQYRVRLRVRIAKALNTEDRSRTINISGREVTVVSQKPNQPLSETVWIIFQAAGFSTEKEARCFGEQLRTITEIAGLCSRLGIDVGQDQPTGWVSEEFARSLGLIKPHEKVFPNIHGLAIVPDNGSVRFPLIEATATVRADPEQLWDAMTEIAAGLPADFSAAKDGVRILNFALMNPQPIAQIALSLSAIESLGQNERWTDKQTEFIRNLAVDVENSFGSDAEYREVSEALRRSFHRIGLRQGVMRIFRSLDLQHLRREWDRIYEVRSGLFHGTLKMTEAEIAQLAIDAITLCVQVILSIAERNGLTLPSITSVHFPGDKPDLAMDVAKQM
ncbi:MAG: hypothetical protein WB678_10295 [Stellaceae bacterium]